MSINLIQVISWLLATLGLLSFYPISIPNFSFFIKLSQLVCFLIIAVAIVRARIKLSSIFSAWFFVFLSLFFSLCYMAPASWVTFGSLAFIIVFLLPGYILKDAGLKFESILCWVFVLSLSIHFLLMLGVDIPSFTVHLPYKTEYGFYYNSYIFNVELLHVNDTSSYSRFCSIFDEPGVVGTLSGLMLVYRGIDFRSRKSIVFLLAGISSLSAAFFVILIFGYFLNVIDFKNKNKALLVVIPLFFMMLPLLGSDGFSSQDSLVHKYLVTRFTNYESINNRESSCFKTKFDEFISSDDVIFGNGVGSVAATGCDVSSPSVLLYEYGVIGGFFICVVNFVFFILMNKKLTGSILSSRFVIFFALPLLASFYQRPYLFHLGILFLLVVYVGRNNEYGDGR